MSMYTEAKAASKRCRERRQAMKEAILDAIEFIANHTPLDAEMNDEWDQMRNRLRLSIGMSSCLLETEQSNG